MGLDIRGVRFSFDSIVSHLWGPLMLCTIEFQQATTIYQSSLIATSLLKLVHHLVDSYSFEHHTRAIHCNMVLISLLHVQPIGEYF